MSNYQNLRNKIQTTGRILGFSKSVLSSAKLKLFQVDKNLKKQLHSISYLSMIWDYIKSKKKKKQMIYLDVVVFSDFGMCGKFNNHFGDLLPSKQLYIVGNRGKKYAKNHTFLSSVTDIIKDQSIIFKKFKKKNVFPRIHVSYGHDYKTFDFGDNFPRFSNNFEKIDEHKWIIEIDEKLLINQMKKHFILYCLYQSQYNESMTRLKVSSNAVDKCNESLNTLQIKYNSLKQYLTTNEINEIIAGQRSS